MVKRWIWLSNLLGMAGFLCSPLVAFSLPKENPGGVAAVAAAHESNQLTSAQLPACPQESKTLLTPPENLHTNKFSLLPNLPFPLLHTSDDKYLPKVFWGYLRLAGTSFFAHNHPLNKAIIEDLLIAKQAPYSLFAPLPYGAKLIRILKDRIVLEKNGVQRSLNLWVTLDNPAEREILTARGYQQVSQNEWLIKPNRLLSDNKKIGNILSEADISLYRDARGGQGLQINKLKEGHLLKELGIREGDIVKGVNEEGIGDIKNLLQTYRKIRGFPMVNLNIERNQQLLNLSYRLLPDGKPKYDIERVLQAPATAKLFAKQAMGTIK